MEKIPMTKSMKDAVVSRHNQLRNKLAGGQTPKYPTASRMREIVSIFSKNIYLFYCSLKLMNDREIMLK